MSPPSYNIALDCIDKHAASWVNKHNTALLYLRADATGRLREPPLKLTYASLQGLTNCFANALLALGIQKGERLVLALPNGADFPISFLGAIKAGVIPVPVSPQLTAPELQFILKDSEAAALVVAEEDWKPELAAMRPDSLRQIIVVTRESKTPPAGCARWQDIMKSASAHFTTGATSEDDPAFWLYTSGTAGPPKAVIHAHRSVKAHDARAIAWQDMRQSDVIFNTSSLNWSYALNCGMLDVWRRGLTSLVYQGPPHAANLMQIVDRYGVSTLMSVPGIYRRLLAELQGRPWQPSALRIALSAGEKLPEEIRVAFQESTGIAIHEGLGMTEHSVYLVQAIGEPIVPGSCGRALENQRIAILNEFLSETAPGESGILASHRSCPGLMLGYHRRAAETAEAFRGDWFLSGDLASRDAEGNFFFLGRSDDVINAGGYRISPLEIEMVMNSHPDVAESAAFGAEIEPGKTVITCALVMKSPSSNAPDIVDALLEWSRQRLAAYKIPRQLRFLDALPKTANGKIRRQLL